MTDIITNKDQLYVQVILFVAFVGHGLASLHFSDGYKLHYDIFSSVNVFHLDVDRALLCAGVFDIVIAFLFLLNRGLTYTALLAILYLLFVGACGWIFFSQKTGQLIGVAELFRRVPWVFCALFILLNNIKNQKHHYLLRIGIAFAFLAHGLASLGFFGLKGGHVELASKILTEETANRFVYYSGISDSLLSLLLLSGLLSRWAAAAGCLWLLFIVILSVQVGIPEVIFRTGFFLMCLYVAADKRCHEWKYEKSISEK